MCVTFSADALVESSGKTQLLDQTTDESKAVTEKAANRLRRPRKNTTYEIFLKFVSYNKSGSKCDTTKLFSKKCFRTWLASRKKTPKRPGESFRRALVSQLTASDGRKPFPPDVEESILANLRRCRVWPCFKGTRSSIGIQGFSKQGFHERHNNSKADKVEGSDTIYHEAKAPNFDFNLPILNLLDSLLYSDFQNTNSIIKNESISKDLYMNTIRCSTKDRLFVKPEHQYITDNLNHGQLKTNHILGGRGENTDLYISDIDYQNYIGC